MAYIFFLREDHPRRGNRSGRAATAQQMKRHSQRRQQQKREEFGGQHTTKSPDGSRTWDLPCRCLLSASETRSGQDSEPSQKTQGPASCPPQARAQLLRQGTAHGDQTHPDRAMGEARAPGLQHTPPEAMPTSVPRMTPQHAYLQYVESNADNPFYLG